jgi:AcrR family transcriptional regulator
MPRAKQRTPELRQRVLRAAADTLAADGVAGFTTRKIARGAATSTPAVYELFGDKAGLVRELFFEGFRLLGDQLAELDQAAGASRSDGAGSGSPRVGLVEVIGVLREFARDHPALADLMFSRPFADFDPGPADRQAGDKVREFIVARVRRCVDAGELAGQPADIAHVILALAQGLAAQEAAGWLGSSRESMDRRWMLAIEALLDGLARGQSRSSRSRLGSSTG